MPTFSLSADFALLIVSALTLAAGAACAAVGRGALAHAVWLIGALPILAALTLSVARALMRRESGMSRCAKRGVLVKGGGALERLAQASILFFDKTGTLTGGQARLVSIDCGPEADARAVLRWAASLAQASGHVISEALTIAARERNVELLAPNAVEETPGAGLTGQVGGRAVTIGAFAYVASHAAAGPWSERVLRDMAYEEGAAVFVGVDGVMVGAIRMADQMRLETPRALRLLKRAGIERLVMLTGDRRDVAQTLGAHRLQEVQRLLYGLEAIVRLHCAQEEELFHAVGALE